MRQRLLGRANGHSFRGRRVVGDRHERVANHIITFSIVMSAEYFDGDVPDYFPGSNDAEKSRQFLPCGKGDQRSNRTKAIIGKLLSVNPDPRRDQLPSNPGGDFGRDGNGEGSPDRYNPMIRVHRRELASNRNGGRGRFLGPNPSQRPKTTRSTRPARCGCLRQATMALFSRLGMDCRLVLVSGCRFSTGHFARPHPSDCDTIREPIPPPWRIPP